jgi:hypothetical protein
VTARALVLVALVACKDQDARPSPAQLSKTKAELEQKMAGAQPGEERQIDKDTYMTMYRTQATSPLPDGWHHAVSTKGGFAVDLPLPFNDFRIRALATDHVEITSDMVGGKSPGLLSYMATCVARADGKRAPDSQLPTTDTIAPLGTPVRAWQRTIPLDGRVCLLIVEAQGSDSLPPDRDIQRFLHSFALGSTP